MKYYIVRKAAELLGISEKTLRAYARAIEVHPQPYTSNGKYKVYSEEQLAVLRAHRDRVRLVEQGIFDPDGQQNVLAQTPLPAPVYTPFRATGAYIEPPAGVVSSQSWCKAHGMSNATFWKYQDKTLRVLRPHDGQQFLLKGRRFTIGLDPQMQHDAWAFFQDGSHGAFTACPACPHEVS